MRAYLAKAQAPVAALNERPQGKRRYTEREALRQSAGVMRQRRYACRAALPQAVQADHSEYLIERRVGRLKGNS